MIVYCASSFLVSYFNEEDVNHRSSRRLRPGSTVTTSFVRGSSGIGFGINKS
jgi:hypothetical protein